MATTTALSVFALSGGEIYTLKVYEWMIQGMERLLILLQPEYAKIILYAFCEYDRKTVFLDGRTVWLMTAAHFIEGVTVKEVAARNNLPVMTAWDILQWSKRKFVRHGLWISELGFPPDKPSKLPSRSQSETCLNSNVS